jgi:Fe-S-cluster containining protein
MDRGDGVCRYLVDSTNLCSIYHDRPIACRLDALYDRVYSRTMTRAEYYAMNEAACARLAEEHQAGAQASSLSIGSQQ